MSGDKHRIDELFLNGMEGHLDMPSPLVWDKIEEELNKKGKKRPFILFFKQNKPLLTGLTITALCIGLVWGGVCYMNSSAGDGKSQVTDVSNSHKVGGKEDTLTSAKPAIKQKDTPGKKARTSSDVDTFSKDQAVSSIKNEETKDSLKNDYIPKNATKKEIKKNIWTLTQRKELPTHLNSNVPQKQGLNVKVNNQNDKLADNSKEQPVHRNPSNEAVANLPYASESVPFKNKTDVAGSQSIIQSSGIVNHNASAVQVAEEQTKLAFIAGVNAHQHDLGPIVKSIVSFKSLPNYVKAPTIQAPAANVPLADASEKKKTNYKRFHISFTPIFLNQDGKIKVLEKIINPPVTGPGQPPIVWNPPSVSSVNATTYTLNAGLLTDIHFNNGFSLQTGLTLSTQYFRANSAKGIAVERPDGSIKYLVEYNIGVVYLDPKFGTTPAIGSIEPIENIKTSLQYVQVPVLLNWHIGNGKLQGVITIGGNYTMLTGLSLNSDIAQVRVKQNITDKEVNLSLNYLNAIGGLGLKWNFNKRLAFVVSSQYQQSITPFLKTDLIKAYPSNLTTQTGIQVSLFR